MALKVKEEKISNEMDEGMPFDDDALLPSSDSSSDEDSSSDGPSSDEEDNFKPPSQKSKSNSSNYILEPEEEVSNPSAQKSFEEEIKESEPATKPAAIKKTLTTPSETKLRDLKTTERKTQIQNPTKEEVGKKTWRKECEICRKMISGTHYPAHVNSVHGNERPFKCDICGYGFTCKSHLIRHGYTHRPTAKKLTKKITYCRFCQWGFFRNDLLSQHEIIHKNSEAFPCSYPECKLSFFSKERLDDHFPIHNDPAPFKCLKCSKGYKLRTYLCDHMRRVHKISLEGHLDSISTLDTVLTATLNGSYIMLTQNKAATYEAEAIKSVSSSADPNLKNLYTSTEEAEKLSNMALTNSDIPSVTETHLKRKNESSASEFIVAVKEELDSDDYGSTSVKLEVEDGMESESNSEIKNLKVRRNARNNKPTRKSLRLRNQKVSFNKKQISPFGTSEDEESQESVEGCSNSESLASSDDDNDEFIPSNKRKRRKIEKCDSDGPIKPKKRKRKKVENKKPPPRKDCDICGKSIITWHLAEHIRAVHDKIKRNRETRRDREQKECDICGKLIRDMWDHKTNFHGKGKQNKRKQNKNIECKICGNVYKASSISKHVRSHTDLTAAASKRRYNCRFCQWVFFRMDLQRDHLKLHEEGEQFPCTFQNCNYSFFSKEMLTDHCRVMHEDPTPFKCLKCSEQFAINRSLINHITIEHQMQLEAYLGCMPTYDTVLSATYTILKGSSPKPSENQTLQLQDSTNAKKSTASSSKS